MSSFFRNVDTKYEDPRDIPVGKGKGKIKSLKARVSEKKKGKEAKTLSLYSIYSN
jgi:hypothetical protein